MPTVKNKPNKNQPNSKLITTDNIADQNPKSKNLVFIGGHIPISLRDEFVKDGKSHFRNISQQVHKALDYYMEQVKKGVIGD